MPSRPAIRPPYPEDIAILDARSRIGALFGASHADYPVCHDPDDLDQWRNRPLEPAYAMVFVDSLMLRTRDRGLLRATRLNFALGILNDGTKDIIAVWAEQSQKAGLWPIAISQLRTRGVGEIGMAVAADDAAVRALRAEFPGTQVTHNAKHLVEASVDILPLAARRQAITTTLRQIMKVQPASAPTELASAVATGEPALAAFWHQNWERLRPILYFPAGVREFVCTTSAVESTVEKLRRRGHSKRTNYATTETAIRELAFVLRDANTSWKVIQRKWAAVRQYLNT